MMRSTGHYKGQKRVLLPSREQERAGGSSAAWHRALQALGLCFSSSLLQGCCPFPGQEPCTPHPAHTAAWGKVHECREGHAASPWLWIMHNS